MVNKKVFEAWQSVGYTPSDIELDAINTVSQHIQDTAELTTWVTPDVAFNMREVIRTARRNYYGIFKDTTVDQNGYDRIWAHITQSIVESEVKNTDLDPKDVTVEAETPQQLGTAMLIRPTLKDWMRKVDFGKDMDIDVRMRAIDGHIIRKVVDKYNLEFKKNVIDTTLVNLENVYIHGNASSLHDSPFAEKAIISVPEIQRTYRNWINVDKLKRKFTVRDSLYSHEDYKSVVPVAEVYEYHADIPTWWIDGKKKAWEKKPTYKLGFVIISNLQDCPVVHKIMLNTEGIKPYEESRLIEVPYRYLGMGRAEQLFGYQLYFNILFNTRRINQLLSSNQLFQFKRGAGITPQMLERLYTGGAVPVQNVGDIARIDTRNYSFTESANEEKLLTDQIQRLTDQNDVAMGGPVPASTPATIGVLQERNQGRGARTKIESLGRFYENLFNRHILKELKKELKKGNVLKLADDPDVLRDFDDSIAAYRVYSDFAESLNKGIYASPEEIEAEVVRVREQMKQMGKQRWINIVDDYLDSEYCKVTVNVSGEHDDKKLKIDTLTNLLFNGTKVTPNLDPDKLLAIILDKLDINADQIFKRKQSEYQGQPMMQGMPEGMQPGQPEQEEIEGNEAEQQVPMESAVLQRVNQGIQ